MRLNNRSHTVGRSRRAAGDRGRRGPGRGRAVHSPPAAAAAAAAKPKPVVKKVKVADDFYSPTKMTIKVGDKVNFVWSPTNVDDAQRDAGLRSQGRQQEAVHVA